MKKLIVIFCCAAVLFPQWVMAHKVIVFAWVEDGMVITQGSFGSKKKAQNCVVKVKDSNEAVLFQGRTDKEGMYSFKVPAIVNTDLIVVLEAGSGHQATWTIPMNELNQASAALPTDAESGKRKEALEQGPSVWKIGVGLAIIALAAVLGKALTKKKESQ